MEIFRAVFLGAVPVALATFAILQWSIASGRMERFTDGDDLKRQYKDRTKAKKQATKQTKKEIKAGKAEKPPVFHKRAGGDLFHNKVMFFGGGFYGTMAVITYVLIEVQEILQFLSGLFALSAWINKLGLELLIEFFVNSVTNLMRAFLWFDTLPSSIEIHNGFAWLIAAYLGYLAGLRLTKELGDQVWQRVLVYGDAAGAWLGKLFHRRRSRNDTAAGQSSTDEL